MSYLNIHQGITKTKSSVIRASRTTIAALVIVIAVSTVWAQSVLPLPQPTVSTVPPNGDVNPYGVAFVPYHVASGLTLQPDDILVSNFNNSLNLQGTGTTVIRVNANGQQSVFYQSPIPLGDSRPPWVWFSGVSSLWATPPPLMAPLPLCRRDRFRSSMATASLSEA